MICSVNDVLLDLGVVIVRKFCGWVFRYCISVWCC